jgi:uncharacterized membrane protein
MTRGELGSKGRIDLIDVARGAAMLLVFLSHFVEALYSHLPGPRPQAFRLVTRIATPAFVWISGLTLAVLFARHRRSFAPTRDRLIDRGLFLILVGHPLFVLACAPMYNSWHEIVRVLFITDTLGAAVILGSLLISRVSPAMRLLLGTGMLVVAWGLVAAWNPPVASTSQDAGLSQLTPDAVTPGVYGSQPPRS